jgi:hypothetical protein
LPSVRFVTSGPPNIGVASARRRSAPSGEVFCHFISASVASVSRVFIAFLKMSRHLGCSIIVLKDPIGSADRLLRQVGRGTKAWIYPMAISSVVLLIVGAVVSVVFRRYPGLLRNSETTGDDSVTREIPSRGTGLVDIALVCRLPLTSPAAVPVGSETVHVNSLRLRQLDSQFGRGP